MKLYWCPQTRSLRALWMLEEAGCDYERELIDIRTGAQDGPAYRAINPMGKVPTLVDGEAAVSESAAICTYVADRFPEAGLAPAIDDPARGRYLRWLFFSGGCIEPAYMQQAMGWETNKSQAAWGDYDHVIGVLEEAVTDAVKRGGWLLGDAFTAADVMIGLDLYFGINFKMVEPRPVFDTYVARCTDRPAYKRAQAIDAAGI